MFREQFREGGDGDIELVLSVLRYELFGVPLRETLRLPEGGYAGFIDAWVSQRSERNRVRFHNDVSVFLILECPGRNI